MTGRYDRFHTHRRSRRRPGHDYGSAGWYFVTICVAGRLPLLGAVRAGTVHRSVPGHLAQACWAGIPQHHAGVCLDAFVVMPNHVHGLIGLQPDGDHGDGGVAGSAVGSAVGDAVGDAVGSAVGSAVACYGATGSTGSGSVPACGPGPGASALSPPTSGSLAVVVRSYKAAVTRAARQAGHAFAWQPRFHDHVVRSEAALTRIRAYIEANPQRWEVDAFHVTPVATQADLR